MKKKDSGQLNIVFKKFSIKDLPKDPKTAAEKVLVFCVMLFEPDPNYIQPEPPDPYDQTICIKKGRKYIAPNSDFNIRDLLPREEGACDAFERDLNAYENGFDLLNPDYSDQWE